MVTISVDGLDNLIKKFEDLPAKAKVGIQKSFNDWADRTAADAKSNVSANSSDLGGLLNSISSKYGDYEASVVASAEYAAFIEFGTKKFAASYVASLPSNWSDYAIRFKGSGSGRNGNFFDIILQWVKRKGIVAPIYRKDNKRNRKEESKEQEAAAFLIAKSILINGIKAQPFLKPAADKNVPLLIEDIKASIRL